LARGGVAGLLAAAFALAHGAPTSEPALGPVTPVDSSALFAAALIDLDGQPTTLSKYRGKPLIVNFWARWCGPCKVEIPELVSLQKRDTGVEVLGLNLENNAATVRDFSFAYDVNYPVFLTREPGLALMRSLGNQKTVLPFTVVLNRHGAIVGSHIGAMTRDTLDAAVVAALKPIVEHKPHSSP
jgi:thiol-disulfide isomerase/thioredoxin